MSAITFPAGSVNLAKGEAKHCALCRERDGHWVIKFDVGEEHLCAVCILRETPWGKKNEAGILELVQKTEQKLGKPISVNGVVLGTEADRIVFAIFMTSRVKAMQKRISGHESRGR